jgi:energy-coupling factor transporter ATP-binding protein EcfA2
LVRLAEGLQGLDMRAAQLLAPELVDERERIVSTIRSYLIPRLTDPGRPMTVVIVGPTGSGKSTILNSLAGFGLAETGALRPTTRTPLVATTAEHAGRFSELGGVRCHVATARTPILTRMALVDTPDIDSTSLDHREMTEKLIDAADVVVFVTSPLRYADLVPWEVLRRVVHRGAPLITVLNRLTTSSAGSVADYGARLSRAGIQAHIVRVPEQRSGRGAGRVPSLAVKELSRRLHALAEDLDGGRLAGMTVAETVLDDASRLMGSLAGLTRLIGRQLQRIDEVVARGRARLDLGSALDRLSIPVRGDGRLRRLLRLPPPRLTGSRLSGWLELVAARLSSIVESELRATAMDLEATGPWAPGRVMMEPALVTTATAIEGWLANVSKVAGGMGRRRNLATATLVSRALGAGDDRTAARALGPSSRELTKEARSDLESRLSVAFSQLSMVASVRLHALAGRGGEGDIAALVTRARARLTFADA